MNEYMTTGEVAERFGVSLAAVHQLIARGGLPVALSTRIGRLISRADVERLARERARRREGKIAAQR